MARLTDRLTLRAVQTARADTRPLMLADGKGLYLRVGVGGGAKSWIYRYRGADGRRHDFGLGPYPEVTLAAAREMALEQRRARISGADPLRARRQQHAAAVAERARAVTFAQAADSYIAMRSREWRGGGHQKQWRQSLASYAMPMLGEMSVAAIDTAAVLAVLRPVWETRTETASRIRERIETVLGWATTAGYRQGDNPARWRGHLENLLPQPSKVAPVVHHPALPYGEIGEFMHALRQRDGVDARAMELLVLTATRSGEVIGARWEEFNLPECVWVVPAIRTKTGREHRVPLSDPAMSILTGLPRLNDYVFPGTRGAMSRTAMFDLLSKKMRRDGLTTHGFRSTFRTWCAERTNFPREVAEMALAHAVGDAVERAYARGDLFAKRAQLMQAWADYCDLPAGTGTGKNVVELRPAG